MKKELENTLALILISKGGRLGTSNGVCRVLSRFFGIISCADIIKDLENMHYIEIFEINGVRNLEITEDGRKLIKQNYENVINQLKDDFPSENEIINAL